MKNKNIYYLICNQRGIYYPANEKQAFKSLPQIREVLIDYHSIDNSIKQLNKMNLDQLLQIFDWSIEKALT